MVNLFVVGVGRSGTSLLQSMFAAHASVAYMPETGFIRRYVAKSKLAGLYAQYGFEAVVKCLTEDDNFSRIGIDPESLTRKALDMDGQLDANIYKCMVLESGGPDVEWVGDKDPRLLEFLPLVSRLFPSCKVVNIIRDPRDVLLSKKKAEWSMKGHPWKHIFANRVQLRLCRRYGALLFGSNYHEIIYEDLISDPEATLSQLCKELGLPFEKAMLDFGEAAKNLVSTQEINWKKETLGPLLKANKQKWRKELAPREWVLTQYCCREAIEAGQYPIESKETRLGLRNKLWVFTGALAVLLMDWPYRWYRNFVVIRACRKLG